MMQSDGFYDALPRRSSFDDLTDPACYSNVPQDWWIGVSDIVDSTGLIADGQYKTVNMVGAATIAAVMNALEGAAFPFVFGGDGAGFAVAAKNRDSVRDAMARVARWALAEFDITMRVALVPVSDALAAGYPVRVARFQVSDGADYAMFDGGGLHWAERQMKSGAYAIDPASEGSLPDLTGLSCRWSHMPARQGTILSIIVDPVDGADETAVGQVYGKVLSLAGRLDRGGHPARSQAPGPTGRRRGQRLRPMPHGVKALSGRRGARRFSNPSWRGC